MKTIEMIVPTKFEGHQSVTDFMTKAELACREVEKLCFIVTDIHSSTTLIKIIRDLRKSWNTKFDVLDCCDISRNEKLVRAFELSGVNHIGKADNTLKLPVDQQFVGLFSPEELKILPQDYLRFKDYKVGKECFNEAIIRLTHKCNERCLFCFLYSDQQDAPIEITRRILGKLVDYNVKQLSFSGGEPTLVRELPELVGIARDSGIDIISLQTNGVLLADKQKVEQLVDSGLKVVFLALHSHLSEISEEITKSKNTHDKTVACFNNCLQADVELVVSCVINRINMPHLYEFARFIVESSQKYNKKPLVNFAISAPMGEYGNKYIDYTPTLAELKEPFQKTFAYFQENEIKVVGFDSACGPPLCILGDLLFSFESFPFVDKNAGNDFFKPEACNSCKMSNHCYGLRRIYLGTDVEKEVVPYK